MAATIHRPGDSEAIVEGAEGWISAPGADCPACHRAHAVIPEASFRYRAWVRR